MRFGKMISLGLLGLAIVAGPCFTRALLAKEGEKAKHEHGPLEHLKHFKETVLKLAAITDDEKTKIEAAFADAEPKVKEIAKEEKKDKADKEADKEKLKPIMKDLHEAIKGILTEAQNAELKKILEAEKAAEEKKAAEHKKAEEAPAPAK